MQVVWEGRIVGECDGYRGGRIFTLSDGSRWRQDDRTDEYVYRVDPRPRRLWEQSIGVHWLDIEGTSAVVAIVPAR